MHVSETRSVRHELEGRARMDLKGYLMSEVARAFDENAPQGRIEAEWDDHTVEVIIESGDLVLSTVRHPVFKDADDYEQ